MELVQLAELGAQVVLDAILLWLVIKYLPQRDKMFAEKIRENTDEMKKHTAQLNRLVNAFILTLDDDDKKRHKVSDDIFKSSGARRRSAASSDLDAHPMEEHIDD